MTTALVSSALCLEHLAHPQHPERPDRLRAVARGIQGAALGSDLVEIEAQAAPDDVIARVHAADQVALLEHLDARGGGSIDADTAMNEHSLAAARVAAGAGLQAVEALRAGRAGVALCAVRPPGHHATPSRSMGFCLLNNVAITAQALADAGERVAIVDIDAHHGNGTHDAFYGRSDVLFVSTHQWPLYPGTGAVTERGAGDGVGATVNLPVPPSTGGEEYRRLAGEVIGPALDRFAPDWILVSAGFDAHRRDPLTDLGLTSADYTELLVGLQASVSPGRLVIFLEGGYDLEALEHCVTDALVGLNGGAQRCEALTTENRNRAAVDQLIDFHR